MNEEKDVKKDEEVVKNAKKVKEVETPVRKGLKSKDDIVKNWLPRYTGRPLGEFGQYILLTNFSKYVTLFSEWNDNAPIYGLDKPMQSVTANGITIINFGMGSPLAATMMDLLTAIQPKAVLFLGKCGGLKKKNQIGDLILPEVGPNATHVYHLYVVRTQHRDKFQAFLTEKGIGTLIHYPIPPHLQKAYTNLGFSEGDFPIAEKLAKTSLSLPIWPGLTKSQVFLLAETVAEFFNRV